MPSAVDYPVPEELDDPRFRRLFDYWLSKHRDALLPGRAEIDPLEIPELLGNINLIDVVRENGVMRFLYRVWGTAVTDLYGSDHTDKFADEIALPTNSDEIQRVLRESTGSGKPHFWQIPLPIENHDFKSNRRLLLPLASDGVNVDKFIALILGDARR